MGVRTRDFANSGSNGINWIKKAEYNQASNTATSFQFNTGLYEANDGFNVYRIIGRVGGSHSSGNQNIQMRWVNSGGTAVSSGYYSSNLAQHTGGALAQGYGSNSSVAFLVVQSPSTGSMLADIYYYPSDSYMFGHIRYHNQSTQLGVSTLSAYNTTTQAYGLRLMNSAGNNITLIDFTTYGAKIDGSLGL